MLFFVGSVSVPRILLEEQVHHDEDDGDYHSCDGGPPALYDDVIPEVHIRRDLVKTFRHQFRGRGVVVQYEILQPFRSLVTEVPNVR